MAFLGFAQKWHPFYSRKSRREPLAGTRIQFQAGTLAQPDEDIIGSYLNLDWEVVQPDHEDGPHKIENPLVEVTEESHEGSPESKCGNGSNVRSSVVTSLSGYDGLGGLHPHRPLPRLLQHDDCGLAATVAVVAANSSVLQAPSSSMDDIDIDVDARGFDRDVVQHSSPTTTTPCTRWETLRVR